MCVTICSIVIQVLHIYQQIQPNPAEYAAIQELIGKRNTTYACSLTDASQPLLQSLAYYICDKD